MTTPHDPTDVPAERARAGEVRHEVRYILFASLGLVALIFILLLLIYWR